MITKHTKSNRLATVFMVLAYSFGILTGACGLFLASHLQNPWHHRPASQAPASQDIDNIQQTLSPFFEAQYRETKVDGLWQVVINDTVIGSAQECDQNVSVETCSSLVPQTFTPILTFSQYDLKDVMIYKQIYNVVPLPPTGKSELLGQAAALVFSPRGQANRTLLIIDNVNTDTYINLITHLREVEAFNECVYYQTQTKMSECVVGELQSASTILNYRLDRLTRMEDNSRFPATQDLWWKYKKAYCKSVASQFRGGTLEAFSNLTCRLDVTLQRLEAVNHYYQRLPLTSAQFRVYRKTTDQVYLLDKDTDTYYRTVDLYPFIFFGEGDEVVVSYRGAVKLDPPQKYWYGIKAYSLDITHELVGIERVMSAP